MMDSQDEKPSVQRRGPQNKSGKTPLPRYRRSPLSYLIIAVAIFTLMMMVQQWQRVETIRWDEFVAHVESGHIKSLTVKETDVAGEFTEDFLA
ncbi:MAG: hypothetical protein JSW66_13765, partial [Phycisphaerales bacterium]